MRNRNEDICEGISSLFELRYTRYIQYSYMYISMQNLNWSEIWIGGPIIST